MFTETPEETQAQIRNGCLSEGGGGSSVVEGGPHKTSCQCLLLFIAVEVEGTCLHGDWQQNSLTSDVYRNDL